MLAQAAKAVCQAYLKRSHHYYYWGLAAVAGLSFGLRFWGLGRFDEWVFDEVYYVQFARAYLAGETVFDAHPPLGKYAIALGIWLSAKARWATGLGLTPVSYRWMNALVGSLIPLLVVGIGQTLSGQKRGYFALLAGAFVAIDGLFITESRYALLNIYVVFWGLLGHWLWLRASVAEASATAKTSAVENRERLFFRVLNRGLSGVALGAAAATKWNGLGYVLSLIVWEGWRLADGDAARQPLKRMHMGALAKFVFCRVFFLGLLPLLTYCLVWWPHLSLNEAGFWALHRSLFLFHQGLGTLQVACSEWFSWPLLIKPISYWYETAGETVYAVNNLGNPALWWLSGAAVLLVGTDKAMRWRQPRLEGDGVSSYLLIGYLANWLPWMMVGRCTYLYLFMPAAVFGFALLAWLLARWLVAVPVRTRWLGGLLLGAIALSFLFWLPLSLGLPLAPEQLQLRWWLPSWI